MLEDRFLSPGQLVGGRDVADGAVQPDGIVMLDIPGDGLAGLFQRQGCFRPDTFVLEASVPAFQLAVALGIIGAGPHVGHAGEANKLFEVPGDELQAIVGDDPWRGLRVHFSGLLEDDLDLGLGHGFLYIPMNHPAAHTVEQAAEIIKCAGDMDIRDIHVPVLVGP